MDNVLDDQLEIDVPTARPVIVAMRRGAPAEQNGGRGVVEGDRRVYRWKSAHAIPPAGQSKDAASTDDEPVVADVRLTSYKSWDEVALWFGGLMSAPLSPAIRSKAAELTKGLT